MISLIFRASSNIYAIDFVTEDIRNPMIQTRWINVIGSFGYFVDILNMPINCICRFKATKTSNFCWTAIFAQLKWSMWRANWNWFHEDAFGTFYILSVTFYCPFFWSITYTNGRLIWLISVSEVVIAWKTIRGPISPLSWTFVNAKASFFVFIKCY